MFGKCINLTLLISLPFLLAMSGDDAKVFNVGDKTINGNNIKPYDNTWSMKRQVQGEWREIATIQEILSFKKINGREVMFRKQITKVPSRNMERLQTLTFDGTTLEPIQLTLATLKGELPPAAPRELRIDYSEKAVKGNVTNFEGKTSEINVVMPHPMFETAMLGLVIAALPLEEGYEVRLSSVFANQKSKWIITATVVDTEAYKTASGETVEAWVVNTHWQDMDSDAVSEGGATEAGGAYSIVTNPPKGFPYVPRYVNNSVDIQLITE